MHHYRFTIYYDNIDHVSEISAKFFNKYMEPRIIDWCRNNNLTNILNPKVREFQRFIDAITSQNIDPTKITLTVNVQNYQQIFPDNLMSLVTFMKFVFGLTYLLDPFRRLYLAYIEGVYPFIGITYFVYNKIDRSSLITDPNNKALILQDIRNLWTMFFFRKTDSHANL